MAVTAYGLGLSGARLAALGVSSAPAWIARPPAPNPSVGLYSDILNAWSPLYVDNGTLVASAWAADAIFAADVAAGNGQSITTLALGALTSNAAYLALASPSNAQVTAQVRLLTREASGLIRLLLSQLDSLGGT